MTDSLPPSFDDDRARDPRATEAAEREADARADAASWLRGIASDIHAVADRIECGDIDGTVAEEVNALWESVGATWDRMDRKIAEQGRAAK